MGKLVTYLSILIFIDLVLLVTGQFCSSGSCTLSSIIFNAIINFSSTTTQVFFKELIGDLTNVLLSPTGIFSVGVTGAVVVGFLATKEFRLLLIPMAMTWGVLAKDFVTIAVRLISLNPILGAMIMIPLTLIYILTIVEWWKISD